MANLKDKLPPPNALVVFEAAARHRNFSRASEELRIVQPAVTRQVRNLESSLQVSLFRRNNNRLTLTPEGEQMYSVVREGLEKIAAQAEQLRGSEADALLIGSTFAFANLWLARRLSALRRALPQTHLNLLISEQYEDFDTGPADCSIRFGDGQWEGMRAHLLFREEVYPIASAALAARQGDWAKLPVLDQPNDARELGWLTWQAWHERSGSREFERCARIEFDNYLYVLDAARAGEGVALGMTGLTEDYETAHNLVRVGPGVRRQKVGYYLVYPEWYPRENTMLLVLNVLNAYRAQ